MKYYTLDNIISTLLDIYLVSQTIILYCFDMNTHKKQRETSTYSDIIAC